MTVNRRLVIFLIISFLAGAITYLSLDNLYLALGVMVVYIIAGITLFAPSLDKYDIKVRKFHECYHFINNFVIALSIKKSIKGAIESAANSMPPDFIELFEGLENMNDDDKLQYFSSYFPFYVYRLFLQIIFLWEEDGGDILQMSKYLISEVRSIEEYITKADNLSRHKYVEIAILWGFCAVIVIVLRFALKDFYSLIKEQILFNVAIVLLMLFILASIYLLIKRGTYLSIKGGDENEKNV